MMRRMMLADAARTAAVVTAVGFIAACAGPAVQDAAVVEDHTHAGGGNVVFWTDDIELFVAYPPHVKDEQADPWEISLTWLDDWRPVVEGSLTLLLRGPGGAREEIVMNTPDRPGVFTAAPTLTATGTWRADMTLRVGGEEFAIPVGQLEVFEDQDALPHDVETPPEDLIAFGKAQQWSMPFAVAVAEERAIPPSVRAIGEIVAPPSGLAEVSAPVAGLVLAGGPSLAHGDRVGSGQLLALIAPTTIDGSYARLIGDVEELEREVARAERLFAVEAVPERRLIEARHELDVARAALATVGDVGEDGDYTYRLRSPISGVVAARHVSPGQRVEAGAPAFTIVNPGTLWLHARVAAADAEAVSGVSGAWFTVEGGTRAHTADRVVSVGSVIDPDSRTLPVYLAVSSPEEGLKIGMLADGHLQVGEPVSGVAVPATAIQIEDGLPVVYAKVGGEAFQRRVVRLGPSDGTWTIVLSGIEAGEQVVAIGGYQVRLASFGDQEISDHGHPH
jgi:RND family efflux transporter MFP subunit